jgi:hypothetical protein
MPPPEVAEIGRWIKELDIEPIESAERDGVSSWDLVLDGRKRNAIRLTLNHEPALGVVAWVHYAPPLADSLRKTYRQLLHWNDELPFVKFAVADDDRPMLSAEIAASALSRDALGLAIARLVAVCDRLYEDSSGWVDRLGKPGASGGQSGVRLLERYRFELAELVADEG